MLSQDQFDALGIEHFGEVPHDAPMVSSMRGDPRFTTERTHLGTDVRLWTTQATFSPEHVQHYRENPEVAPVTIWEDQGDKFIMDGHHRTIAAREEGRELPAIVYRKRVR